MFIAIKTEDGKIKGKISFYCRTLKVSRQAFNNYLKTKGAEWKYQSLADAMMDICQEDECNNTYGRIRMYQVLRNILFEAIICRIRQIKSGRSRTIICSA